MKKEKTSTARLGFFVITAFLLFTIVIYNIGNRQNKFGAIYHVSTVFNNVNGLKPGNNVRYSGIKVGSVDEIIIRDDSTIQVDLFIEKKVQPFIKKDAVASIGTDGLVGNMIVNINPGKGDLPMVEDGDFLQSFSRTETGDMLNSLGNTTENIALLTVNLLEIAENINHGEGSISKLINDPSIAKDLQMAMRNLRISTQQINLLSTQLQISVAAINEGEGLLGYLLKDTTFEDQINQITMGLDTLLLQRTVPIMDNLEITSHQIATASADINNILEQVDLNKGLAGTLLKDSSAALDLKETLQNLNKGTDNFNEIIEALKHNFLFRKYFKKQEKERKKKLKAATVMQQ